MTDEIQKRPQYFQNCVAGFSQEKLLKLGLDLIDAHIFQWLLDFMGSGKMTPLKNKDGSIFTEDGKIFHWVKYQAITSTFPIFGINTVRGISKRFERYVEKGLLSRKLINTSHGKANFFAPTDNLLELKFSNRCFSSYVQVNSSSTVQTNAGSTAQENLGLHALKNSPTKNSPETNSFPQQEVIKKITVAFESMNCGKQNTKFVQKIATALLNGGLDSQQIPDFLRWLKIQTDGTPAINNRKAFFFHRLLTEHETLIEEYKSHLKTEYEKKRFLLHSKTCPACGHEHQAIDSCCPVCGISAFEEKNPSAIEEHKKMTTMPKATRMAMESELEQMLRESVSKNPGMKGIMNTGIIFDQVYRKYGIRQSKEVTDEKGTNKAGFA